MASRFPLPPVYSTPIPFQKKPPKGSSSQSTTFSTDAQQPQGSSGNSLASLNAKKNVSSDQIEWDSDTETLSPKEGNQSESSKKKTGFRAQWKKLANSQTKPGYIAMGGSF